MDSEYIEIQNLKLRRRQVQQQENSCTQGWSKYPGALLWLVKKISYKAKDFIYSFF